MKYYSQPTQDNNILMNKPNITCSNDILTNVRGHSYCVSVLLWNTSRNYHEFLYGTKTKSYSSL